MAEAKETEIDIEDIQVRLKPILGVKPGLYLTILYAALILLILFLLFFLPGIRKHGSLVRFDSFPDHAAVYVDDAYAGVTPFRSFIASGSRGVTFVKLGFAPQEIDLQVPGRVVGSLMFPKRIRTTATLSLTDPDGLLSQSFAENSSWALVNPFTSAYRPEPVLSNAVGGYARAAATQFAPAERVAADAEIRSYLEMAVLNASGPELAGDLIRAAMLAFAGSGAPMTTSALETLRFFIGIASEYENSLFLLPEILERSATESVMGKPWFAQLVRDYGNSLAFASPLYSGSLRSADIGGYRFIRMPEGVYAKGMSTNAAEHAHLRTVSGFLIQAAEVTQGEFAEFIREVPEWGPDRIDTLIEQGLVTDDYLADWDPEVRPDYPVRFVSWYAANAFAQWLDSTLRSELRIRLPSETEWEWAALLTGENPDLVFESKGRGPVPVVTSAARLPLPANLLGSLWEWCDSWYFPNAYLLTSISGHALDDGGSAYPGAERVLRGGSWADDISSRIDATTRGSNPPSWCTPFAGFRVVAIEPSDG